MSGTFSDADHRTYIAEHWVKMLEESIRRIDAFRSTHPDHPIVDVQYDDLMRDPVGAVETIYSSSGDTAAFRLDASARGAMSAYAAAHPKDSMGVHGYDLAEFGLDAAQLGERFSDYVDRYDVPSSRPAR